MGIIVKDYKLGGGSLVATVYVQLGRQPIATQRKRVTNSENNTWDVIYVALAHAQRSDEKPICSVHQAQKDISAPLWKNPYEFCYEDLKAVLTAQGYEVTDSSE